MSESIVMQHTAHLWVFFVMVLGVVLLPGLDMVFVTASALVGGRRSGLAATAGIVAGGICHMGMAALGIVAVLQLVPAAFNIVLLAGAIYIAWIGVSLLRSRVALDPTAQKVVRTDATVFRHGMMTSLLNPKAYLFMFAIVPQFIRTEYGPLWRQAIVLWMIIATTQIVVYGGMAMAGDHVRAWLQSRPAANANVARAIGVLLLIIAVTTAFKGCRGS